MRKCETIVKYSTTLVLSFSATYFIPSQVVDVCCRPNLNNNLFTICYATAFIILQTC